MEKTLIIAEIGSSWRYGASPLQHLVNAQDAIRIAKESGASCIKFQRTEDPRNMERRRKVKRGSYDILHWPKSWISSIYKESRDSGIEFMCTAYNECDVEILNQYVKRWKIASLECRDSGLYAAMKLTGKPIICSHGANDGGIYAGTENLHCTVAYPAPADSLNLRVLQQGYSGYSDHSADLMTGALAVACGAKIIEVHFRLSRTPKDNPDYQHSHSPERLKFYIENIKKAEIMLGDGYKKVEKCEQWALKHKVKA